MPVEQKLQKLKEILLSYRKVAVAFSGGVDSSLLCSVAREVLGEEAVAITVVSPMLPQSEREGAASVAAMIGIRHILFEDNEIEEMVAQNPENRCYHCKKVEFGNILKTAGGLGIEILVEGSNIDDLSDYRPGLLATKELGVRSPLREAGLTKDEIRGISQTRGLPTWNKPAFACLASRIPYGERINTAKLGRIEAAEDSLRQRGFVQFRVRSHGDTARIEVAPEERTKFFDAALMDQISKEIKSAGFLFVSLELEGYKMGNLNRTLKNGK